MRIKLSVNVLIQILALVAQILNGIAPVVPQDKKPYLALGIMAVQGIVSIMSHRSNPDGTPAEVAYVPTMSVKVPVSAITEPVSVTTTTAPATLNEAVESLKEPDPQ